MSWTAIWNDAGSVLTLPEPRQKMAAATFLLEDRNPGRAGSDDLVWQSAGDPALSLLRTADGSFDLNHRGLRLRTDPGLVQPGESFRVTYRTGTDGRGGLEVRSLDRPGVASLVSAYSRHGVAAQDFQPSDPIIQRFSGLAALANHDTPFADGIGVQCGAHVETPAGPRAVETLAPGDVVMTETGAHAIVTRTETHEAVTLGSMNAVRLRAPYFGLGADIFVTRRTPVLLSGPAVDYTFGAKAVTVDAGDLVNSVSILRDLSEPVRQLVTLTLDRPGCVMMGRLRLGLAPDAMDTPHADRRAAHAMLELARGAKGLIG